MIDKNIGRAADDKFEGHEIELSFRPLYNITCFYISSREMDFTEYRPVFFVCFSYLMVKRCNN